jgi:hypothetical protein
MSVVFTSCGLVVTVFAIGLDICGFKPAEDDGFFNGDKNP